MDVTELARPAQPEPVPFPPLESDDADEPELSPFAVVAEADPPALETADVFGEAMAVAAPQPESEFDALPDTPMQSSDVFGEPAMVALSEPAPTVAATFSPDTLLQSAELLVRQLESALEHARRHRDELQNQAGRG